MGDGKHVGYVHDMDDALAIVHAYNLAAPVSRSVAIQARIDSVSHA
jgi:hypothetical protein